MTTATKEKKKRASKKSAAERPKQTYIEGTEPMSIPVIDRAADKYREIRDERMELTEEEAKAKASLMDAMRENLEVVDGRAEYLYDGQQVIYTADQEENVKVKSVKSKKTEDE